jgi:hypothetical protein
VAETKSLRRLRSARADYHGQEIVIQAKTVGLSPATAIGAFSSALLCQT